MAQNRPMVGQRYRNLDGLWKNEWIVDAIRTGSDTYEYAHLRSASDPTRYKTLSLLVVADPTRFALIAAPAGSLAEK